MRAAVLTTALALAVAAPASAAEPIMPLSQVQRGMHCTGLSVVQGTDISSFDVEILDIVAGDDGSDAPRILVRVSGPAVDATGIGPGFSGSPVICRDSEGRDAYAGAISEGIGEYGGKVGLATPMEQVVGQPVEPPVATQPAPRGAYPLTAPLSIGGVSPRVARFMTRLAAKQGKLLIASTGKPRAASFPPQQLRPGASMSAGLSSGPLAIGAIGTVSYVDGDQVWAFGHPLDGAGRRSLFLQDAYVYTVVNNPLGVEGVSTYKLASPGHDVGVLSGDGLNAVAGRLGVMPDNFPLRVIGNDGDTGRHRDLQLLVADENPLGQPMGVSSLALVGTTAVSEAAVTTLGEIPARESGEMCATFRLTGDKSPLRFCNRYVERGGALSAEGGLGAGAAMVADFAEAVDLIDSYEFGTLDLANVEVNLTLRRGLRQAYMLKASGPRVMRRGHDYKVRVRIQAVRGPRSTRTIKIHVPLGMPAGRRRLTLNGPDIDEAGVIEIDLSEALFGEDEDTSSSGPRTVAKLRKAVGAIGRYDGVEATFDPPPGDDLGDLLGDESVGGAEGIARKAREVYRDPDLRLSGTVRLPVVVR